MRKVELQNGVKSSAIAELDVSPKLDAKLAPYYQSLIGILRWIVGLGRVDICVEVSIDHTGDSVTRRFRTDLAKFLNQSRIYWYSKK